MSAEEQLNKIKEQNRLRAQKYYEANKAKVAERRKASRQACKEALQKEEPKPTKAEMKAEALKTISLNEAKEILEQLELKTYVNPTNQLVDILDVVDFHKAFKNSKNVIYKIETATLKYDSSKLYSINSKKLLYQTILKLLDVLDITIPKATKNAYVDKFHEYKVSSHEQTKQKVQSEEVMNFQDYLAKVKEAYGEVSKEYIIACLYHLSGFRDDLQLVIIPTETKKSKKELDKNYIVIPTDKKSNCFIILNVFKTDKKYEQDIINIPKPLSKIIREYVDEEALDYNDYIFGNQNLSKFISKFNTKIGLKITINNLRQMKVSSTFSDDPKERVKLSKSMKHSALTSEKYVRKVKK